MRDGEPNERKKDFPRRRGRNRKRWKGKRRMKEREDRLSKSQKRGRE